MSDTEIVLRSPNDLLKAINGMLIQMNKKQRKGFLEWVKQKRNQYDFNYPQGYVPKEETINEQVNPVTIVDTTGTPISGSVPVVQVEDKPTIVDSNGEAISSADSSKS